MKKKLIISFSGGRTSAYMTWWLMNEWEDMDKYEIIVVFANTGKEVEGTLFFVDECAQEWNIHIVWVEAVPVSVKGWKVKADVVTFVTASRKGEPFERMIKILGIPCSETSFCSPQLKREAILAYAKSIGWEDFYVAIGVRADEPNRVKRNSKKQKVIYPLVDLNPKTKSEILQWWSDNSFNLDIHSDDGNCDNCWKKSFNVLCRNMQRNPDSFTWWEDMEKKYGEYNPRNGEANKFLFYRGGRSVQDIKTMSEYKPEVIKDIQLSLPFEETECGESCEAF